MSRALLHRASRNKLAGYRPYSKQREFHRLGSIVSPDGNERLFMAGNQQGKTVCGAAEIALHLTGRYPDWWDGAVFDKPTKVWVAGVTGESTRDNPQRMLVGPPQIEDSWGTGMIPHDALLTTQRARGVPDSLDSCTIRFGGGGSVSQGESILIFKSYEKGREKLQGDTIDAFWFDEEPPEDVYSEGRVRTQRGQRGFFTLITFTPLLGLSEVVRQFISSKDVEAMA
jgi:phage terminase large subunit-like protein